MITFKNEDHANLVEYFIDGISAVNEVNGQAFEYVITWDPDITGDVECDDPEGPIRAAVVDFRGWRHQSTHDSCSCREFDCDHTTRFIQLCMVTRLLEIALVYVETRSTHRIDRVADKIIRDASMDAKFDQFLKDLTGGTE